MIFQLPKIFHLNTKKRAGFWPVMLVPDMMSRHWFLPTFFCQCGVQQDFFLGVWGLHQHNFFLFFFFNPLYFWPTTLVVFGFFLLSNQDWFIQLCWRHHNLIRICEVSLLGREGCTAPSVFKQLSWCFLICYFDFCVPLFGANQRIYAHKRMKINQNCIFMAAEYWSHKIICRNKYKLSFLCWWKNS